MRKSKFILSVILSIAMVLGLASLTNAQDEPQVIEVAVGQEVVIETTADLDLAGYDAAWWTGERYLWVSLTSNDPTDYPALVSPYAENDPPVMGAMGVSIEENQQVFYLEGFGDTTSPGAVDQAKGVVNRDHQTITFTQGPIGAYTRVTCNVDPDGWPAPEEEFNFGQAFDLYVTVDGVSVELEDPKQIIILWTEGEDPGETQTDTDVETTVDEETPAETTPEETTPAEDDDGNMMLIIIILAAVVVIIVVVVVIVKKKK